jgi:hypothetical protein
MNLSSSAPVPTVDRAAAIERVGTHLSNLRRLDSQLLREHGTHSVVGGHWPLDLGTLARDLRSTSASIAAPADQSFAFASQLLLGAADQVQGLARELGHAHQSSIAFGAANIGWTQRLAAPTDVVRGALMVLAAGPGR